MVAREILIMALSLIASDGYVSKQVSRDSVDGKLSTSEQISSMYMSGSRPTSSEEAMYGARADEIINWLVHYRGTDEFYLKCKGSFKIAQTNVSAAAPYICALPSTYERVSEVLELRDIGSRRTAAIEPVGATLEDIKLTIFSIRQASDFSYTTVKMIDDQCRIYTTYVDKRSKINLNKFAKGDTVLVSGTVTRHNYDSPSEVVIKSTKIKKEDQNVGI